MKWIAVALALLFAAPAFAQDQPVTGPSPVTVAAPPATVVVAPAPAVIETGTLGGQVLLWVMSAFGTTIGAALTAYILRVLKNAGVQGTELLRSKLQDIIINGLNLGAKEFAADLQGKGTIEVKNAVVARAVVYAQDHGAETLTALGINPTSPEAVEAIKARIETAINDPVAPTPPVLDKASVPAAAAV